MANEPAEQTTEPQQAATETAAGAQAQPVLDVRNLTKVYGGRDDRVVALDGVDLQIDAGSFTAIMGASGSGKSTLLHLLGGLALPSSGSILVEGRNLAKMSDHQRTVFRRRRMGVIFQDYNLLPTLDARENVALPLMIDGKSLSQLKERVDELLALVHLEHRAAHRPDAMSGGEQQRVAIARALLTDPAIILADEPTGNLDSKHSREIWGLLRSVAREQKATILMVTHEAAGAAFADDLVVLKDGQIVGRAAPKGSEDAALVANCYQELAG